MDWSKHINKRGNLSGCNIKAIENSHEYIEFKKNYNWTITVAETYYCHKNGISKQPRCYCGKELKYETTQQDRYGICCSYVCSSLYVPVQNARRNTILERLGVENASQSDIIKDKKEQTNLKKRGVKYANQDHIPKDTYDKLDDPSWLRHQHHDLEKPMNKISSDLNISDGLVKKYMIKHNISILYFRRSQGENELFEYIKTIYDDIIIPNDRSTLPYINKIGEIRYRELDIYLPKIKLAFEYDGRYWHGNKRQIRLDLLKDNQCIELDIELNRILDVEWENDKERMKTIIKNIIKRRMKCQIF